jgi:hypothetical protein
MSRTTKTEWSTPDGWSVGIRLERQARPAGRIAGLVAAELAAEADGPDLSIVFVPVEDEDEDCGCSCRRCLLHGDCGGCLTGHLPRSA